MKEALESSLVQQDVDEEHFANRKLIRPALPRNDHNHGNQSSNHHNLGHMQNGDRRERHGNDRHERGFERNDRGGAGARKPAPPEQTNAENFYYQKQMQSRTPMVVVLQDGEEIHGVIEWYDKSCIKVVCTDSRPNLMIYKPAIKYMYKEEEGR